MVTIKVMHLTREQSLGSDPSALRSAKPGNKCCSLAPGKRLGAEHSRWVGIPATCAGRKTQCPNKKYHPGSFADGSQELLLLRSNQTRRTPLEEAVVSGNIAATETLLRAMPPREFTNLTRQALLRLTRTFRPMHDHTGRALRRILHDHFRELDREGKTPDTAKETAKARTTDAATLTISCKLDQDKNASNARSR